MAGGSQQFNPVNYNATRKGAHKYAAHYFSHNTAVGDFDGDGHADLVQRADRQLSLFLSGPRPLGADDPLTGSNPRSAGTVLLPTWTANDRIYSASGNSYWKFDRDDEVLPGDFDGDGKTDLYCINRQGWSHRYVCLLKSQGTNFIPVAYYVDQLPGWGALRPTDEFYVGDLDGDGRDDLMVFNGLEWNMPYFCLLRSTGTALTYLKRYDNNLPGNQMGRHETFRIADLNGDGRADVVSWNTKDWAKPNLGFYTFNNGKLNFVTRYYGTITGPAGGGFSYTLRKRDQLTFGDLNGDGRTDLALFNDLNWSKKYLTLFACDASARLQFLTGYVDQVPGWTLKYGDTFYAADVDGDGDKDLIAQNTIGWENHYLGILRSNGTGLSGAVQQMTAFSGKGLNVVYGTVADFHGNAGWEDLFLYTTQRLVLIRSQNTKLSVEAVYPDFIHNHRFHAQGWW